MSSLPTSSQIDLDYWGTISGARAFTVDLPSNPVTTVAVGRGYRFCAVDGSPIPPTNPTSLNVNDNSGTAFQFGGNELYILSDANPSSSGHDLGFFGIRIDLTSWYGEAHRNFTMSFVVNTLTNRPTIYRFGINKSMVQLRAEVLRRANVYFNANRSTPPPTPQNEAGTTIPKFEFETEGTNDLDDEPFINRNRENGGLWTFVPEFGIGDYYLDLTRNIVVANIYTETIPDNNITEFSQTSTNGSYTDLPGETGYEVNLVTGTDVATYERGFSAIRVEYKEHDTTNYHQVWFIIDTRDGSPKLRYIGYHVVLSFVKAKMLKYANDYFDSVRADSSNTVNPNQPTANITINTIVDPESRYGNLIKPPSINEDVVVQELYDTRNDFHTEAQNGTLDNTALNPLFHIGHNPFGSHLSMFTASNSFTQRYISFPSIVDNYELNPNSRYDIRYAEFSNNLNPNKVTHVGSANRLQFNKFPNIAPFSVKLQGADNWQREEDKILAITVRYFDRANRNVNFTVTVFFVTDTITTKYLCVGYALSKETVNAIVLNLATFFAKHIVPGNNRLTDVTIPSNIPMDEKQTPRDTSNDINPDISANLSLPVILNTTDSTVVFDISIVPAHLLIPERSLVFRKIALKRGEIGQIFRLKQISLGQSTVNVDIAEIPSGTWSIYQEGIDQNGIIQKSNSVIWIRGHNRTFLPNDYTDYTGESPPADLDIILVYDDSCIKDMHLLENSPHYGVEIKRVS